MIDGPPRELTPGEIKSLERVALLRGKCGRLRRAIRDALQQIPYGTNGRTILVDALEERS